MTNVKIANKHFKYIIRHPLISRFPSSEFYDNRIIDGVSAEKRPTPQGFPFKEGKPVAFVRLPDYAKEEPDSNSYRNNTEAQYIIAVCPFK